MGNKEKQPQGLVTIERVVAFVLGPAVVAGAGWLSTLLAREIGIEVSSKEMIGVFSAAALGAAGLVYKWLDGRSKHTLVAVEKEAQKVLTDVGVSPSAQDGIIHMAEADLEKFAQNIIGKTVGVIHTAETTVPSTSTEPQSIPVAVHDPAPPTPVPATPSLAPVQPQQPVAAQPTVMAPEDPVALPTNAPLYPDPTTV